MVLERPDLVVKGRAAAAKRRTPAVRRRVVLKGRGLVVTLKEAAVKRQKLVTETKGAAAKR